MKKLIFAVLFVGSFLMADSYSYNNPYLNKNNNDDSYNYQGSSGIQYKYDLSNPSDKMNYDMDLNAKMNDSLNVNPNVGLDRSLGQYGGGIQNQ